jgi:hypothetical protein
MMILATLQLAGAVAPVW